MVVVIFDGKYQDRFFVNADILKVALSIRAH